MTTLKANDNRPVPAYWTFETDDGERMDCEFTTRAEALKWAEEGFCQQCNDEGGWRNGDSKTTTITLIEFQNDDGTITDKSRSTETLEFRYYHGDHAEHFSQSDYI